MAKNYVVQFGVTFYAGLNPTFTAFSVVPLGGATTPPGITAVVGATGLYYFTYEPLTSIAFILDGATTGLGIARYITGSLDPVQAVDERIAGLSALITTGNSNIGNLGDSMGSTLTDPQTIMGYLRRLQEFNEGDSSFTKSSGLWQVWSRGNTYVLGVTTFPGASTQLTNKSVLDSGSVITKS